MSSLINKVKEKLHSDNKTEQPEGTHGPHSSRAANAADPRVDSDRDHREQLGRHDGSYTTGGDNYSYGGDTTTQGTTGTSTLDSSKGTGFGSTATTGPASKTAGMHSSNLANKADPRVDSDLDGSRNMGLRSSGATAGTGTGTTGTTRTTGTTGTTGFGAGTGTTKTAGMHSSDMANKADPRVDSDLDGSRNMGLRSSGATAGTGTTGTTGFGTGTGTTKTAGMHSSDMANKADPRIDSDLDGSRNMGLRSSGATYGTGTTGTSGTTMGTGMGTGMGSDTLTSSGGTDTYGSTGMGRTSEFSSGTGHQTGMGQETTSSAYGGGMGSLGGGYGTTRQATGPAPTTAGPHKSDMMNKMDPRVDSDLDNSKTFGGDKTYSKSDRTTAKDPTDAAQVPPSVLRKHIGEPTIEHGDSTYDRVRRHSVSHQEQHRGL
ncbi:hypothetical protein TrVFT333_000616 [Trichoderma virens FT-333]|nr:hypothetical protein TrVFT333_000616 [Trichoderma virens FT-333]